MEDPADILMDLCKALDARDAGLRYGEAMRKAHSRALHWRVDERKRREAEGQVSTHIEVVAAE